MAKKSAVKRIRITKRGKLMRRSMAQDHFRAKKTGKQIRQKRSAVAVNSINTKLFKVYLGSL
ncbi:MAG: hypothetical protein A3H06_02455 [Candidatus Colwellbacteria bacterium RIFCSPLOWO2_12_FULL_44_13]|uniref:50S ribosomal protein L35 n=3 Tax=Candidatus Colwelliibacteriota TaxID=1817904 RepID=A0A1G1Z6I7_9BACT|nr:MAG: hypothetical protein A3F24_03165 [Candidatus Colwellbacteria bacterium RIFCSPHIGHO2_12_FULL_44_17]OGY60241.1 MAG: hypothetical protein A3I31_00675 [Candidatus Colwellbacteria bacterium RIFCSPLOWO2_02_FULL_44_20b]OGY62049.1 MAG: hypothetical protein A3H06_02455 [Candidatus Colwellbacteria bacterium RIFCSPLOWO2_12_FULL_44_13]